MEKNTKYGKVEEDQMIFAPALLSNEDVQIINPTAEDYSNNGYKFIFLVPSNSEYAAETILETKTDITYFY